MAGSQPHRRALNQLVLSIFTGKYPAGAKLPTERELAGQLDVDRTSLRIALKQLESMQVLDIRHGDGIYVLDLRKNAGVDFLRLLFQQEEDHGQGGWPDPFLIDEIWEFWASYFPAMLRVALVRVSSRGIQELSALLDRELSCLSDRERITDLEVLSEDLVAEATDNLVFLLISNSSRPLRRKMIRMFLDTLDDDALRQHVAGKKRMLDTFATGRIPGEEAVESYRKVLERYRSTARAAMHRAAARQGAPASGAAA